MLAIEEIHPRNGLDPKLTDLAALSLSQFRSKMLCRNRENARENKFSTLQILIVWQHARNSVSHSLRMKSKNCTASHCRHKFSRFSFGSERCSGEQLDSGNRANLGGKPRSSRRTDPITQAIVFGQVLGRLPSGMNLSGPLRVPSWDQRIQLTRSYRPVSGSVPGSRLPHSGYPKHGHKRGSIRRRNLHSQPAIFVILFELDWME